MGRCDRRGAWKEEIAPNSNLLTPFVSVQFARVKKKKEEKNRTQGGLNLGLLVN